MLNPIVRDLVDGRDGLPAPCIHAARPRRSAKPEEKAMPSAALLHWQNERMPRLNEIDTQCAASLAQARPNPRLVDENLRGYVVLLSAHFQGFCRDLYVESSQIIASKVRRSLRIL